MEFQKAAISSAAASASPPFLRLLRDERVRTVLVAGCGGGFDFMHSGNFIPMFLAWNKQLIFHSYSFGNPASIQGGVKFDFAKSVPSETQQRIPPSLGCAWPPVCAIDGACCPPHNYGPEVALCQFLDRKYPGLAPKPLMPTHQHNMKAKGEAPAWWLYASYARDWTPLSLQHFYHTLALLHGVDAILIIDGGSDSLMKGDEAGLGDPIEDATSVAAVASLPNKIAAALGGASDFVPVRVLVALGFGCDRFNTVQDRDGFAAIAALSAMSRPPLNAIEIDQSGRDHSVSAAEGQAQPHAMAGFLGVHAIERFSVGAQFYSDLIDFTQENYSFRSVIANSIVETTRGAFGDKVVPATLRGRVAPGELDLWPLMSFAFAFDVRLMMKRSLLCLLLLPCKSVEEMYAVLHKMRKEAKCEQVW